MSDEIGPQRVAPKRIELTWLEAEHVARVGQMLKETQAEYDRRLAHARHRLSVDEKLEYKPVVNDQGRIVALELAG